MSDEREILKMKNPEEITTLIESVLAEVIGLLTTYGIDVLGAVVMLIVGLWLSGRVGPLSRHRRFFRRHGGARAGNSLPRKDFTSGLGMFFVRRGWWVFLSFTRVV